jgi:hypothetical protein
MLPSHNAYPASLSTLKLKFLDQKNYEFIQQSGVSFAQGKGLQKFSSQQIKAHSIKMVPGE